jgi:hypothetical protein
VDETQPVAAGNLLDDACLQGAFQRLGQALVVRVANGLPQSERHLLPDHRRDRQQPPRLPAQPLQPSLDDLAQERRHPDAARVFEDPVLAFAVQDHLLLQRPQQLEGKESVPGGEFHQVGHEPALVGIRQPVPVGH